VQIVRKFCPILNKFGFDGQIFLRVHNIKFNKYSSSGSRADRRMDGRTNIVKLICCFGDCANALKNEYFVIRINVSW
jgi:hypothetical protein